MLTVIAYLCAGCAAAGVSFLLEHLNDDTSCGALLDVPFVKQEQNYCGPAALSSVLNYWNIPETQEEIAGEIFEAQLRGVLNVDLERFAKDKGLWAKGYQSDFQTLKSRLQAGIPLIVLEKLHPFILNRHHYTVIVGYSDTHKIIVEHTGKKDFVVRSYNGFKRNWYAAGSWMLEVMPVEKIDTELNTQDSIELGLIMEKKGEYEAALERYHDALKTGGETPVALFNIGNVHAQREQWGDAEEAYHKAIKLDENCADCYNNLAYVYLKKEDYKMAHEYVERALALESGKRFYYLDTKAQILFAENRIDEAVSVFQKAQTEQKGIPEEVTKRFYEFWQEKLIGLEQP